MADCPSGRYLDEIVTAGGLTLAHPTDDASGLLGGALDWSGSEWKFADWNALVVTLMGRVERSWLEYKTWPATAAQPNYNDLAGEMDAIRLRYAKIRKPWVDSSSAVGTLGHVWGITLPEIAWDATEEIGQLAALAVDIQCLRQRLNEALASAGGNPVTPGDTGHKPRGEMSIIGTIGLALGGTLLAAGTIYLIRKTGK